MYKRFLTLALVILSLFTLNATTIPAHAGGQQWSAWMFNQANGQMSLVTSTVNTPQTLTLPLLPGYTAYGRNVAISHDWHYMAYLQTDANQSKEALSIYDRNADGMTYYSAPSGMVSASLEFAADENLYNETNTAFAFGYSLSGNAWEIQVLDLTQSNPTSNGAVLRSDNPAVQALGIPAQFISPSVRRFQGNNITFQTIRLGTEGAAHYDSYVWDIVTNQVQKVDVYPGLPGDTYTLTGETLSTLFDTNLPTCGDACNPFFTPNTVNVYDPTKGSQLLLYTDGQTSLTAASFIQNGERILVSSQGPNETRKYVVLDRSGANNGQLFSGMAIDSMTGWQDGFLFMPGLANPTGSPTLVLVTTRGVADLSNMQGSIVWTGVQGQNLSLQETPLNMQGTGPFTPWKALDVSNVPQPTLVPAGNTGSGLKIGTIAVVSTTSGDSLRLRSGPGTSNPILALLKAGTLVSIIGGPQTSDGLTWWEVKAPANVVGWVVESVTDNGTQIQTLIPQ